jgi:hypothetical protein
MPRKGKASIPSTTASTSNPDDTGSLVPPGSRKKEAPKQTVTTTDTFRQPARRIKQEIDVSQAATVETKDTMIRRRVGESMWAALHGHSLQREQSGGKVDSKAINIHKNAIAAAIRSYQDDLSLVVPENSKSWGCEATVTNDKEKHYPILFSLHAVPCETRYSDQVSTWSTVSF